MKKFLIIIFATALFVCVAGCTYKNNNNYKLTANLESVSGRDDLYYDIKTKVVYIIFDRHGGHRGYGYMSAYYAPNGLPYLYDANNHELIEIDPD